jgi:preprotein translocase subunit SecD
VDTSTGEPANNVKPDPQYSSYPSTSIDTPNYSRSTVLLPGLKASGTSGERYVLGPSEMAGRSISSAKATLVPQTHQWAVDYTLAGQAGSALWDKVAQESFHALLGIELDGVVYSAPIIQPTQSSFTSFDGKGEISGGGTHGLTHQEAEKLAQAMNLGALPVTLTLEKTQS